MMPLGGASSLYQFPRGLYSAARTVGVAAGGEAVREPASSRATDAVQLSASLYARFVPSYATSMSIMGSEPTATVREGEGEQRNVSPHAVAHSEVRAGAASGAETSPASLAAAPMYAGAMDSTAQADAASTARAADDSVGGDAEKADESGKIAGDSDLSEDEKDQVEQLKARDMEVRQHEQAHQSAGAGYAGSASYTYQRGPDGNNYAVGGEVSIDTSDASSPDATAAKMRIVRSAALAPANPSGQDLSVAAFASKREMEATREASEQRTEEAEEKRAEGQARNKESQGGGEAEVGTGGDAAAAVDADNAASDGDSPFSASSAVESPAASGAAAATMLFSRRIGSDPVAAYGSGRPSPRARGIDLVA